jgi:hypothetical protein
VKRLYILIIFVFSLHANYAQKYQPYDTNIVWKVFQTGSFSYYGPTGACYRADVYNYFVKGYILNNGLLWHKVFANVYQCTTYFGNNCNAIFTPTNSTQFIGMFSNDTINKKVYFVPTATLVSNFTPNDNNLIFNSNKTIGDTMFVYSGNNPSLKILGYKITNIDSVLLGTKYHKIFLGIPTNTINYSPNYAHFIEGVGSDAGVFNSRFNAISGWSSKLGCFSNASYTKYFVGINNCNVSIQAYPNALRDTTVCFSSLASGLKSTNSNITSIKLHPNPVNDMLNIELLNLAWTGSVTELEIINTLGQVIHRLTIDNHNSSINIKDLPSGFYFIKIFNKEGLISTTKIIKE